MSTTSAPSRKQTYDPARQWGLKPSESHLSGSDATYVISGHVVSGSGSGSDSRSLFVAESMGREGQAKAQRKLSGKDADKALKALLERDKEGMRAVVKAREVAMQGCIADQKGGKRGKGDTRKGKSKEKTKTADSDDSATVPENSVVSMKKSYSAGIIKQLGFDPAVKLGRKRADDATVQKKVNHFFLVLY